MNKAELFPSPAKALSNAEFYQFINAQSTRFNALSPTEFTDAEVKAITSKVLASNNKFHKIILNVKKNLKTVKIVQEDKKRELSVRSMKLSIKSFAYAKDEEQKAASQSLLDMINSYGSFNRKDYEEESTIIDKIIEKLEGPEYSPMVALLNIGDKINEVKSDNANFKTIYEERRDEAIMKESVNAQELRAEINEDYSTLCQLVQIRLKLTNDVQYQTIINIINTVRNDYNTKIARSKTAQDEEKKKDNNTPEV